MLKLKHISIRILGWSVLCTILLSFLSIQTDSIILYVHKSWYIEANIKEETFVGTLVKSNEVLGPANRQNALSLITEEGSHQLYDPESMIPSECLNTKIRIKGKLIEDKLSGISNEIWPGVIEPAGRKK
jgi:hypothetical protein